MSTPSPTRTRGEGATNGGFSVALGDDLRHRVGDDFRRAPGGRVQGNEDVLGGKLNRITRIERDTVLDAVVEHPVVLLDRHFFEGVRVDQRVDRAIVRHG